MRLILAVVAVIFAAGGANGLSLPLPSDKLFQVVWQMPHGLCKKHETPTKSMDFDLGKFGIISNPRDRFNGEYISIFYHFGKFPMHPFGNLKVPKINGGIPQKGNITLHMTDAVEDIKKIIPSPNFKGLAIINQEEWRPNFDRNFGWKDVYQDQSIKYYAEEHPEIDTSTLDGFQKVMDGATEEFEAATRLYSEASLQLGNQKRPHGKWGYYAYPYCYNYNDPKDQCSEKTRAGNTRMKWLWEASTAIYPSIYMFVQYEPEQRAKFLYAQIEEGVRVANLSSTYTPVYIYTKMKYNMNMPVELYRPIDMYASIRMPADFGVEGIILWGSDPEFNDLKSCSRMKTYITETIGPYVKKVNKWVAACSKRNCNGNGKCVHRGALNRKFRKEIYRLTMKELNDFSISNYKHVCVCHPGYTGRRCDQKTAGAKSSYNF